jgi:predicted dehydrogenase
MRDLGFAIVGCGMIARFHARALAEVPGTRVAALFR